MYTVNSGSGVRFRAHAFCSSAERWRPPVLASLASPSPCPARGHHEVDTWPQRSRRLCRLFRKWVLVSTWVTLSRRGDFSSRGSSVPQQKEDDMPPRAAGAAGAGGCRRKARERLRRGQAPRALGFIPSSQPKSGPKACEGARATLSLKTDNRARWGPTRAVARM